MYSEFQSTLLAYSVYFQVADMLLELCVTELEDVATDSQSGRLSSQPVVVESSHPYTDDTSTSGTVKIPGNNFSIRYTLKGRNSFYAIFVECRCISIALIFFYKD